MAEGLPEGLVTNSEAITGDIQGVDHIDAEDLAHLWRVYTTNRNLLANDVGRRLENFFWRIWSNGRIRENIRGSQIARLFVAISEGDVVIRTTPTSSPRASRILPTFSIADRLGTSPTPAAGPFVEPELADTDERLERQPAATGQENLTPQPPQPPTIEEEKGRRRGSSRPPPILKKTRTDSTAQQSKTARILTPTWKTTHRDSRTDSSSLQASFSKSVDADPTENPSPPDDAPSTTPPTASPSTATKTPKKKPTFTASSSSSKRRPTVPRRKSSQSSSSATSKAPSPRLSSQATASPPPPLPSLSTTTRQHESALPHQRRPTSRSASPVSSGPFHRPTRDHLPAAEQPGPHDGAHQDWLVDPHFRAKFADRSRAFAPFPARGDVATRGMAGVQARGRFELGGERGKARVVVEDEEGDEGGEGRRGRDGGEAVLDDDEDDEEEGNAEEGEREEEEEVQLPRTKSQLTMLLERDRRGEGGKKGKGKQPQGERRGGGGAGGR